jgi:UDP-N-acetylglucosamine 4,6-dehydratase
MKLVDLAEVVGPGARIEYVGIRPGEKIHEVLLSEDEARSAVELDEMYVIKPSHPWWKCDNWNEGKPLPEGFRYISNENSEWLSIEDLGEMVFGKPAVSPL